MHDDGRILPPTARNIWTQLLEKVPNPEHCLTGVESIQVFAQATEAAENLGRPLYEDLVRSRRAALQGARERKRLSFESRQRSIERIGLPSVRQHRLKALAQEEAHWRTESESHDHAHGELIPRLVLRVEGLGNG